MHWQSRAVCGGARAWLFFGPDGETEPERRIRERQAKAVCAACLVRAECLDYALEHHMRNGIWGGLTEDERRQLRRERQANWPELWRFFSKHGLPNCWTPLDTDVVRVLSVQPLS